MIDYWLLKDKHSFYVNMIEGKFIILQIAVKELYRKGCAISYMDCAISYI